jgi:hypothetical protein
LRVAEAADASARAVTSTLPGRQQLAATPYPLQQISAAKLRRFAAA